MNACLHREHFGLCKCASKSILLYVPCVLYEQFTFPGTKAQRAISCFVFQHNLYFIFFNTKYKNSGEGPQSTLVNTTLNNPSHIMSGMTGLSAHYRSLFLSSLFEFNKKKEVISGRVGAFSYTYDKLDI